MIIVIGLLLVLVFLVLAGIHVYWFFGGTWQAMEAIPTNIKGEAMLKPSPLSFWVVIFGLLFFGFLAFQKTGVSPISLPSWLANYGLKVVGFIFLLRAVGDFNYVGFFKKVNETVFAQQDSQYYIPLCITISLMCFILDRYAAK